MTETAGGAYALRGAAHPYYATEGCYYASGYDQPHYEHESWGDFLAEMGQADLDMNLLYRWDWEIPDPTDYDEDDGPSLTTEHLALFYMQQRKARPVSHRIVVTREDEQRIGEWLAVRAAHLRLLWSPLLDSRDVPAGGAA
jgi:hypothetical protein